jgi:hypothetical protein
LLFQCGYFICFTYFFPDVSGILKECDQTIAIFDICLECKSCIFDESKKDLKACDTPGCEEPRTSKHQILVVDIVRRFQRLMKHRDYAKAFRYGCFICLTCIWTYKHTF